MVRKRWILTTFVLKASYSVVDERQLSVHLVHLWGLFCDASDPVQETLGVLHPGLSRCCPHDTVVGHGGCHGVFCWVSTWRVIGKLWQQMLLSFLETACIENEIWGKTDDLTCLKLTRFWWHDCQYTSTALDLTHSQVVSIVHSILLNVGMRDGQSLLFKH